MSEGFNKDDILALNKFSVSAREELKKLVKEAETEMAKMVEGIISTEIQRAENDIAKFIEEAVLFSAGDGRAVQSSKDALSGDIPYSSGGVFSNIFKSSDSVIGKALGKAMDKAMSQFLRKGRIDKRKVLKAGLNVVGSAVGGYIDDRYSGSASSFSSSAGSVLRLSKGQLAVEMAGELQHARRNS